MVFVKCDVWFVCVLLDGFVIWLEIWVVMYEDLWVSLCCWVVFDVLVNGLCVYVDGEVVE